MNHARSESRQAAKRPRPRVGPGILLAAAVGAILLYGQVTRPQSSAALSGQIVYEADAQGHLRRVAAPSTPAAQIPTLWKPEVGRLLEHDSQLNLRSEQRAKLKALNTQWQRGKAEFEQQIQHSLEDARAALKRTTPEHTASPATVAGSLSDYSALSAQYDQQRMAYWAKAVGFLTPAQRGQIDSLRQLAGKQK